MHPSPLALEQLLVGQGSQEVTSHLLACEACRTQLAEMEKTARRFSASPTSLRARDAAKKADLRWKQRAAAFTLVPAALLAVVFLATPRPTTHEAPQLAVKPTLTTPKLRQGREVLEPRPGTWTTRLRTLPIRGHNIEFGQGSLEASDADGPSRPFTLTHTRVDVTVTGFMQAVTVTQTFTNPFKTPVEAIYVFPLPDDSAVHEMTLTAGTRVIRAQIQKRAVARQQYEEAKAQGRRAALLDQERPNIFTQSLANLLPGETVEVALQYIAPLHYDDGVYTLNFPMVVGPRYVPGASLPGEAQGTGVTPDTDVVPDASRISPPSVRSGRDVEVNVRIDAGTVIEDLWSVSHRLEVDRPSSARISLTLSPLDTLPNKDLVVRWRVSGTQARASMLAAGGAFALMLNPESKEMNAPATPKEMVFVIDTSCSMNGPPLEAAKRAMHEALEQMNPDDTFMLIDFAEHARAFNPTPLPATATEVRRAIAYLHALPDGGSTNQLAGLRKALARPEDPKRLRMVLLMTDGFIGNEEEIFAETRRLRGNARVFGFGIGSSVNHFLLSRLSQEGRGFYQYIRPDEDAGEAVGRFVRRVRKPLITDVTIDWGGLQVADTLPEPVSDLYDAQPLIIQGRYRAAGSGTVVLRGKRAGVPVVFEVPVTLPELSSDGRALAMAWARQRIERLSAVQYNIEQPEVVEQITSLGLEYHLVTKYTSLVAVENVPVTNVPVTTVAEPTLEADQTRPLQQKRFNTIQVIRGSNGSNGAVPLDGLSGNEGNLLGGAIGDASGYGGLGLRGTGSGGGGLGTVSTGTSGGGALGHGSLGTLGKGGGAVITSAFGPEKPAAPTFRPPPPRAPSPDPRTPPAVGEDFDQAFGSPTTPEKPVTRSTRPGGYIPPAPGAGGEIKESLGQSDIMEVVLSNKSALKACVERQHLVSPGLSGKILLSWIVEMNGRTSQVKVVSREFENTEIARCLLQQIRTWVFPQATKRSDVTTFPFKF